MPGLPSDPVPSAPSKNERGPTSLPPLPLLAKLCLALLGGFTLIVSFRLWPEWRHNPDLSHGLFMPFLFLFMLHESRVAGLPRYLSSGPRLRAIFGALVLVGLLALALAGLYAAALGWSHTLVEFLLVGALVLLLGAGLVVFADTRVRALPCNWSALVAIGLWLLSAPLPPGTYTRLTLGLQLWVSKSVLLSLHLLGIAAHRTGNVIELASTSVGVEEACSGVRSLLSCVFAGFFFSATLVRTPWARALIIGLSAPLALGMNFLRSLTLTLLANSGVNIAGAWHDVTGYAVLGATAVILGALALRLERRATPSPASSPFSQPLVAPKPGEGGSTLNSQPSLPSPSFLPLASALLLSLALVALFVFNTRSAPRSTAPVPDLLAVLPAESPGWLVDTSRDLYQFTDVLQTQYLAQRTYTGRTAAGAPVQITLYLAYWPAGQSTVSRVAAHTPDACWPGSGWTPQPTPVTRESPVVAGRTLASAEYRFFKNSNFPQHVWFWHLFDGRPIAYQNPYSTRELFDLAWRYGFRHDGDQLFVRVSSTGPWADIAGEPLLREFFARLQPLGL